MQAAKRQRPAYVQAKRPIDKSLKVVNKAVSTTQQTTVLETAAFPCTLTGLRVELACGGGGGNENTICWALVRIRDGQSVNALSLTDGATMYEPEQDVLLFGKFTIVAAGGSNGPACFNNSYSTKTKRKLMVGDQLAFTCISSSATATSIDAVVQSFCQT